MYQARCYRTLDRPITVFGLEIEDLLAIILLAGGALFVAGPFVAILSAFGLYAIAVKFKAGRPPGYIYERLYRRGLTRGLLSAPHLVPLQTRYSAVTSDDEEGHPFERLYWRKS
jgi:hypothetical protein